MTIAVVSGMSGLATGEICAANVETHLAMTPASTVLCTSASHASRGFNPTGHSPSTPMC